MREDVRIERGSRCELEGSELIYWLGIIRLTQLLVTVKIIILVGLFINEDQWKVLLSVKQKCLNPA